MPTDLAPRGDLEAAFPAHPLVSTTDERAPHLLPSLRERSKKETWLLEKARRPDVHLREADLAQTRRRAKTAPKLSGPPHVQAELRLAEPMQPPGSCVQVVTTLYNLWTREGVPLIVGQPYARRFQLFLRDRFTKQSTQADVRLAGVLAAAAIKFRAPRVEVVSGYRSPKYNLMLRKKGHEVAKDSQHTRGQAVDFRIPGVAVRTLDAWALDRKKGGVGLYLESEFVHVDVGPVRRWNGT